MGKVAPITEQFRLVRSEDLDHLCRNRVFWPVTEAVTHSFEPDPSAFQLTQNLRYGHSVRPRRSPALPGLKDHRLHRNEGLLEHLCL